MQCCQVKIINNDIWIFSRYFDIWNIQILFFEFEYLSWFCFIFTHVGKLLHETTNVVSLNSKLYLAYKITQRNGVRYSLSNIQISI